MHNSLPESFVNRIQQQLGKEANSFIEALDSPTPVSIRINPAKGFSVNSSDPVLWTKNGFYLRERPSYTLDPIFHAGAYYVQEASSMFLEQAFMVISKESEMHTVLDLCASPGGKSTHLLSLMNAKGLLISNEVIGTRLGPLQENISKWGYSNVITTNLDPKAFSPLTGFFDLVLIDAPCSGEGLFRKDPKAIQEWSEMNANNCVLRQNRIIQDVISSVKPGGYIIYSTCTYNPEENINQIEKVITEHNFEALNIPLDPNWGIQEYRAEKAIGYQFYPHKTKGEGFFLALLRNKDTGITKLKKSKQLPVYKADSKYKNWLEDQTTFELFEAFPNELSFINKDLFPLIGQILAYIPVKKIGTKLGEIKGKDFIPHHDLALSIDRSNAIPVVILDKLNALQYLRRDHFNYDTDQHGWHLVQFEGQGIGWVNITSGRANNKLPMNLRIRNL